MNKSVQYLKGIGAARAASFARLGIHTVEDLLYFFPRTYEDRSVNKNIEDCMINETVCLSITVSSAVHETRIRRNMAIYTVTVYDETGSMQVVWFNNKYVKNVFSPGQKYVMYGKVGKSRGKLQLENPIYEKAGQGKYTGKIVPVYPLTGGLVQKNIQSAMSEALNYVGEIKEYLPDDLLEKYKIQDINSCLNNIHFPDNLDCYKIARERFVFEELLMLQLALFSRRKINERESGIVFENISGGKEFKRIFRISLPMHSSGL